MAQQKNSKRTGKFIKGAMTPKAKKACIKIIDDCIKAMDEAHRLHMEEEKRRQEFAQQVRTDQRIYGYSFCTLRFDPKTGRNVIRRVSPLNVIIKGE